MKRNGKVVLSLALPCLLAGLALAKDKKNIPAADVVSRQIAAVGYKVGAEPQNVPFIGTTAAPRASGEAIVEAKKEATLIDLKVKKMPEATTLGPEFLTYVLWTVTPDGVATNLGEVPLDKEGDGKLKVTSKYQTFAMIVTAEPYFAVSIPSEVVVLENNIKGHVHGTIYPDNSYTLMKRTEYARQGNPLALTPDLKKAPLDVYEARNAVEISKSQGADSYAPDIYAKATASLENAEGALHSKRNKAEIVSEARATVQFAEDARELSAEKIEAERIQKEKDAAAAAAAAQAQQDAGAKAAAERQRQEELNAEKQRQIQEQAQAEADAAAARAKAQADEQAEQARQQAAAQAAQAKAEADAQAAAAQARTDAAREEAERAKQSEAALRAQLLQQLNAILQTTDTPRGLVVNMADVLFAFGKYNLKPEAEIKLAKLAGVIQAHPGLHLEIDGHTDSIGSDEANLKLSQERADMVRDFLGQQGLPVATLTAVGMGKSDPIADNDTAQGRQRNRRVEIIVSGEAIGAQIGQRAPEAGGAGMAQPR
jgi:outer membrane protein OmpA-like peptidoglycan-associated protein